MPWAHDPAYFPSSNDPAGNKGNLTVKVKNIHIHTLSLGQCAVFFPGQGTGTAITIITDDTYLAVTVSRISGIVLTNRVVGCVVSTKIEHGGFGYMAYFGKVDSLAVTGNVSKGDWLRINTTEPFTLAKETTVSNQVAFAVAMTSNTTSSMGFVNAFVLPWRV